MNRICAAIVALLAQGAAPEPLDAPSSMHHLSGVLTEISGLAPASATTVFAHNDEFAIVHELDVRSGEVLRSFALGKPTVAGDFEGVAAVGGFLYLATSKGLLYEARPEGHGKRVDYNVYDTGLGKDCEVEGMAPTGGDLEFYLLCKRSKDDRDGKRLVLYKWAYAERLKPLKPILDLSLKKLGVDGEFKPADLARDARTGDLFVVDSAHGALLEISAKGEAAGYWRLLPGRHPQAEGLALLPDGTLVVGDEGQGGQGLLTAYPPRRRGGR